MKKSSGLTTKKKTLTERVTLKNVMSSLLNEAEKTNEKVEPEDSLDAQVDKYLISYEQDSKPVKQESFDFRTAMRSMLSEADEEKDEEKDAGVKLKTEDIDMEKFVNNVMRLIANYDSLLEVRDTILKRSLNFVANNYEKDAQMAFEDMLLELYGVKIGSSRKDVEDEYFPSEKAAAAGPAGSGT